MLDYLFGTVGFMPHGMCLLWRPDIVVMHVGADVLIFLAYSAIALSIYRFVQGRPEFRYHRAAMLSAAFVGGCGIAHLFGAVSLWWPAYGAQAVLKLSVALVSIAAALTIWRIVPTLVSYPTPSEIEARQMAEDRLRRSESELKVALRNLRNANEAKANFLAAMSHDLRTPLNAILGFSETLKLEILGKLATTKQAEYVAHIHSSGQHLLTLVNDLLDLSGIEGGTRSIRRETISVRPLLEGVVRQFEVSSAAQNRRVHVELDCPVDSIFADPVDLQRMVNNLLANSAKYGGRDGKIVIGVASTEDGVTLSVTDDGPGFPDGNMESMRAPFVRERNSDDGIGIGLAIVDTLIRQHGGEMVLGNGPKGGARVTLDFPHPPVRDETRRRTTRIGHPGRRIGDAAVA